MPAEAAGAVWHPSPNFGPRRDSARVSLVVLHYTAMASAEAALARLCDPGWQVSAHYLIAADGRLWQMVHEADRAWHAGHGSWGGHGDVNSRSIGIELDNAAGKPYPPAQMARLRGLLAEVMARHALPPEAVIGHSDMAPDRKLDPGRQFDWRALARAGLSVWPRGAAGPDAAPETALGAVPDAADRRREGGAHQAPNCAPRHAPNRERFLADARAFGYPHADLAQLLDAVRQRFRPQATGPLSAEDMDAIADLARRFPVDRGARAS